MTIGDLYLKLPIFTIHSKNWGQAGAYHSAVDTFLRQKLSTAKPHLGTALRLKQPHPAASSFCANTDAREGRGSWSAPA